MADSGIAIIGNGKLGNYLTQTFTEHAVQVDQFARNPRSAEEKPLERLTDITPYRLVLLAISDAAIGELSAALPPSPNTLVAHLSGVNPAKAIAEKHQRRAAIWPLMSFSGQSRGNFISHIPFCVETSSPEDEAFLKSLIRQMGGVYYKIEPEQKPYLHLAAVMSQNFSNHLMALSSDILAGQGLDFKMLLPLLKNALERLEHQSPEDAQTGPAIRHDVGTIIKHRTLLEDELTQDIYTLLTKSIQKKYENEL